MIILLEDFLEKYKWNMINFQSILRRNRMFHSIWNINKNEEDYLGSCACRNSKCNLLLWISKPWVQQWRFECSLLPPTCRMQPSSSTSSMSYPSSPSPSSSPAPRQEIHLDPPVRLQSRNLLPLMPRSRLLEWSQGRRPQALQLRHQRVQGLS